MTKEIVWYEGPGGASDPRAAGLVPVSLMVVDARWQRSVKRKRIDKIAANWDWRLAETITLKLRQDGKYYVVEGQNRVLALREKDPESEIWSIRLPGVTTPAEEAAIAVGIADGRQSHSSYAKWKQRVNAGDPHEVAAEQALASPGLNLLITETASHHGISAVTAVTKIVHGTMSSPRTPEEGAYLLQRTVSMIMRSITDPQGADGRKFDSAILTAVAEIMNIWPGIDEDRLSAKLMVRNSTQWLSFKAGRPPAWSGIFAAIVTDYDMNLRSHRLIPKTAGA